MNPATASASGSQISVKSVATGTAGDQNIQTSETFNTAYFGNSSVTMTPLATMSGGVNGVAAAPASVAYQYGGWGNTVWGAPGIIEYSEYPTTRYADIDPRYVPPGETGRWGYGMLWWAWDPPVFPGSVNMGPWQGAFSAMGSGGQYITVFPARDLVVVHKVNIDQDDRRHIDGGAWMTMLEMVIDAKCDSGCN